MPNDQVKLKEGRVAFVREGEKLSQENFAAIMRRFMEQSYAPAREREPNETLLHYTQNVDEVRQSNVLCADAFLDKLRDLLSPEQKRQLVQNAPPKSKDLVRDLTARTLASMLRDEKYKENYRRAQNLEAGPEKARLEAEIQKVENVINQVSDKKCTIEQMKQIVKPFLTEEQMNGPVFKPETYVNGLFLREYSDYVAENVAKMLTDEQMQELQTSVENYKLPWDRTHEEMGEKVYTAESETAKAAIDEMANLSPEQKAEMKAAIDAANDFLRKPIGEDPESAYMQLSTDYEKAALRDGNDASQKQIAKEGLEPDVFDSTLNEGTLTSDITLKEGKEKELQEWEKQEFKFSPKTKESIKHVFGMMQKYGYGGKGVIGEEGTKQYGLSPLAGSIRAYKKAIAAGDPVEIAKASKAMMTEKEHLDEMLDYVKQNFPIDRHSDNFAKAGNIDVVRNPTFPPDYRYNDAVSAFNSIFIMMNFAEANGMSPEEFLEHPSEGLRKYIYEGKGRMGLQPNLAGKTGGDAFFEASRTDTAVRVLSPSGAGRAYEAMYFLDMDPAIRAHNHGLGNQLEKYVFENASMDINRRTIAYKKGHIDRYLFVHDEMAPATILGLPLYNSKTLSYDQPEEFNEADYLRNNGKSVAEMKEFLDENVKKYLLLKKTQTFLDLKGQVCEQSAYKDNAFVALVQQAASKILIAKYSEKGNGSYDALKSVLTDGEGYVNALIQEEKNKVIQAENALEQAEKAGNQKEIERLKAYIEANKAFKDITVKVTQPQTRYAQNLEAFENKIAQTDPQKLAQSGNLKPDEDFNKSMAQLLAEQAKLHQRLDARREEVGQLKVDQDDEAQILSAWVDQKRNEIHQLKQAYIAQLDKDVKAGRIVESFKDARLKQINDPKYKFDTLPPFFPVPQTMSKEDYINSLVATGEKLDDYDQADRDALYDVYVQAQNALRERDVAEYVTKHEAEAYGFSNTASAQEEKAIEQAPEVQEAEAVVEEEKVTDFTGRWFEPGTQPSKEAFLAKFHDVEKQQTLEPQGNNWLEKCQSKEAAQNEMERLKFFYNEALQVLSPEGKQAVFEALTPGSQESAEIRAKERYAALLKDKSPEAKELSKTFGKMSFAEVKKAAEPYLTREEKKDPKLVPHNHIASYYLMARNNPNVWKPIFDNLSEQQFNDLAYRTESHKAPLERSLDENKVEKFGKEFDSVKDVLKKMSYYKGEEFTEERRAEIEGKLDMAKGFMAGIRDDYDSALSTIRTNREEYEPGMNYERSHVAFEILKKEGIDVKLGGNKGTTILFNGFKNQTVDYKTTQGSDYEAEQVLEQYDEQYKKLRERKIQMRPETKDAIRNIFAKFDQYGFDQGEFNPEEGGKIYGLQRYAKARGEMEEKLASNDPIEKVKAVEAAEKMITEYNHAKEIIDMAKDAFGVDKGGFYSGNMDVERNGAFPPEFRSDIPGVSALNGLYVMYRSLKEQNVDLDAFLDDPGAYMNAETKKILEENHVDNTIKGKSGAAAIADICTSYAQTAEVQRFRMGRAMETLAKLETDPEMARNNMASEYAYSVTGQNELLYIKARDDIVQEGDHSLDNFLIVKEPQQDASLACFPTYDFDTMRVRPVREFDEMDYLAHLQETPQEYVDRILKEGGKTLAWTQQQQMSPLSQSDVVKMIQKASLKYLVAHPELDKRSDAYKTMNDIVEKGPSVIGDRLQAMKDGEFADELGDLDLDRLDFESMEGIYPSVTLSQYAKSREMRNFGEDVRTADKNANRELSNLQAQLNRAKAEMERATSDFAVDKASQKRLELEEKLEKAIADRKEQLMKDFREGRITEHYLNKRNEQLDNGKFRDLPKMFEADELMSKNDYLRNKYPDDFASFGKDEKDELYKHYVDNAKLAKDQFVAKKYLEALGLRQKFEQKTMAERIAEKDAQLAMQEKAQEAQKAEQIANKGGVQQEQPNVQNIHIDLDDEPQQRQEAAEKEIVEVKEEEKVMDEGVERIDLDLDDNAEERNNDMLAIGNQKKLEVDPLKK